MAIFLYLASAVIEAIEVTAPGNQRATTEGDGAIGRQHDYRMLHGLDREDAAEGAGVG